MATASPASPFLQLPIELRYAIYDHLCLPSSLSYPYKPPSPISSIDICGPPMSLLLTNHTIFEELSTYYFSRCTFRFVAQSFTARSSSFTPSSFFIIRRAKNIELLLLPGTMQANTTNSPTISVTLKNMSAHWLAEQMGMLRDEAKELKVVIVSMRRVSWNHELNMRSEMEALLRPLEVLSGKVNFRVGEIMGPQGIEAEMKVELNHALERLNNSCFHSDGSEGYVGGI